MHWPTLQINVTHDWLTLDLQVKLGRFGEFVCEMQGAHSVVLMHGKYLSLVATDNGVAGVVLEGGQGRQDLDDADLGPRLFVLQSQNDGLVLVGQLLVSGHHLLCCIVGSLLLEKRKEVRLFWTNKMTSQTSAMFKKHFNLEGSPVQ